jgi:hypothetical protein
MRHMTVQQVADVLNRMNPVFDADAVEKRAIGMYLPRATAACCFCSLRASVASPAGCRTSARW